MRSETFAEAIAALKHIENISAELNNSVVHLKPKLSQAEIANMFNTAFSGLIRRDIVTEEKSFIE